jgi:mannose-6-phosphate isomerase-like protein (cupin superfamily)
VGGELANFGMNLLGGTVLCRLARTGGFEVSERSAAPQYQMEIDNEGIRARRMQLAPGEFANHISQKAPGVRFILSGGRLLETSANGETVEQDIQSGDLKWLPPAGTRSVTNGGATPLEFIEVELK